MSGHNCGGRKLVSAEGWYLLASLQGGLLRFGAQKLAQHSQLRKLEQVSFLCEVTVGTKYTDLKTSCDMEYKGWWEPLCFSPFLFPPDLFYFPKRNVNFAMQNQKCWLNIRRTGFAKLHLSHSETRPLSFL